MVRIFRHHIAVGALLQLLADGVVFVVAVILAVWLQGHSSALAETTAVPALAFAALMVVLNVAFGLYGRGHPNFADLLVRALLAFAIGAPTAWLLFSVLPYSQPARDSIFYVTLYSLAGLILVRQAAVSARTSRLGARPVLVVGSPDEARKVETALEAVGFPQMRVVGVYPGHAATQGAEVQPLRAELKAPALPELVQMLGVREVIIAKMDQRGGNLPMEELLACRIRGIPVTDFAHFFERTRGEVPIESLRTSYLVFGEGFVQDGRRQAIKRTFDFMAASVLFVLTLPLMLLTAIAIRLESPGPVIYRQERTGEGGLPFTCLKFRSMCADAEKDGVARWAQAGDSRVTRIGRFIRKTRIDELPQLVNVLRGDMSFVGPRPERPSFVDQLKKEVPFYDVRHCVKPGLTGWAQVKYTYGASVEDARRKLQFDLYYVKNNSLFLDILVLLETVRVVLFREGAR